MNILIRLPNWMGDMVMSSAFVRAVRDLYPEAAIDLIAKKGIDVLLDFFPEHGQRYIFSKEEFRGISGAWKFGKQISQQKKYDLFFCLPDSLSSAVMAYATGASKRVGYRKEGRSLLLTASFNKRTGLHRVDEYQDLLQQFTGKTLPKAEVKLKGPGKQKQEYIVININSEAVSRRLPEEKAVQIIDEVRKSYQGDIFLVGSNKEAAFVDEVYTSLASRTSMMNLAGVTPIPELAGFLEGARLVLTTDSGPAHLSNALGTYTIVLFGAGNEHNTAPYNRDLRSIIRLNKLSCEPCTRNTCKPYGIPACLTKLDEKVIMNEINKVLTAAI
jgi:heptosyltransferase II